MQRMTVNMNSFLLRQSESKELKNGVFINANFGKKTEEVKEIDTADIGATIKDSIVSLFDPTSGMTDEEKANFEEEIQRKLEQGEELTDDEMQYLRMNNPVAYTKAAMIQMRRKILEAQIEACKSKEEVEEVCQEAALHVDKNDPAREETLAAYQNVEQEEKKTQHYHSLPEKSKEDDERTSNRYE